MFGEDRWPWITCVAGEQVIFFHLVEDGMWNTVLSYRLLVSDSVSIFGYLDIQQP